MASYRALYWTLYMAFSNFSYAGPSAWNVHSDQFKEQQRVAVGTRKRCLCCYGRRAATARAAAVAAAVCRQGGSL